MPTRPPARPLRPRFVQDPLTGAIAEVRQIQPYAATKPYRCPGCNQEIARGTSHVVVVPLRDAGERRHWHTSCFERRSSRRPGR
ncbi:MAG: hypothetical protein WB770_06710 [Acidimicrobiales bacterium]